MEMRESGQVTASAAEVYEDFFVPALFAQWGPRMAEAARAGPGDRALDVACGTGVLARELAGRVGPAGRVVGIDLNDGMLAVARRKAPGIDWRPGRAEALPFDDGSFDAVLCQFGLMFFEDRRAALREMIRVLRPGGRLAVAVWDAIDHSPGYAAMLALLERLFGEEIARGLRMPFVLGDLAELERLFSAAGIAGARIETAGGIARFPSLRSWVFTDVRGWTYSDKIDDRQFERLLEEARRHLRPFVRDDGSVSFDMPAHLITATRP